MNNSEIIKTELKEQKRIIEEKGGTITVANDYPSPFEITAGIETIKTPDFTITTATEADVAFGKTFYSKSSELKTGSGMFQSDMINHIFMINYGQPTTEERVYYTCPSGITKIKPHCFFGNLNPIHFKFNPEITIIDDYAFYEAQNFTYEGFHEITNLKEIGEYAFAKNTIQGINYGMLPDTLIELRQYCFAYTYNESVKEIILPPNVTTLETGTFRQQERRCYDRLDVNNIKTKTLSTAMFFNVVFDCDLVLPEGFSTICAQCFYGGGVNNLTLPKSIYRLEESCFNAYSTQSLSEVPLKTVTFLGETPPLIGNRIFSTQCINNGFKIYVPDTAVDTYKAASALSAYVNHIYPMSQKE